MTRITATKTKDMFGLASSRTSRTSRTSIGLGHGKLLGRMNALANRPSRATEMPGRKGETQPPQPQPRHQQRDNNNEGIAFTQDDFTPRISENTLRNLEMDVLDSGVGVKALRRFNDALDRLSKSEDWESILEPVWAEMAFNLESFNPVFTACLLKVQCTIGSTDYVARDVCLQNLIQPLAGEYGLHEGEKLDKTHRMLFSDWYTSVTDKPLSHILGNTELKPEAGQLLFAQMMKDVSGGGGFNDPVAQASYALGYNLAVEYLANPEKTWLLDSFQRFNKERLASEGKHVDWKFLEVHALGEKEHADIGHEAVAVFAPAGHSDIVRKAMEDHDRDFAAYYTTLAKMLEEKLL